jgi:hypothetical protein
MMMTHCGRLAERESGEFRRAIEMASNVTNHVQLTSSQTKQARLRCESYLESILFINKCFRGPSIADVSSYRHQFEANSKTIVSGEALSYSQPTYPRNICS